MKPSYMRPRPSSAKVFKQTSMTIPGLAVSIQQVIEDAKRGQPGRCHTSGSYDDVPSLDHISPFQRGFELTDFASSPGEVNQELNKLSAEIKQSKSNKDSRPTRRQAEEPAPLVPHSTSGAAE